MNAELKPAEQLSNLFGNYKAEWLRERIFELYTQPSYFPELETFRPCILVGGRGTGKTTVLRSLSYEGRFAFSKRDPSQIDIWPYYGFYYRVDTNRVMAFGGSDLSDATWTKLFAHYLSLVLCEQVLEFLAWYSNHRPEASSLTAQDCARVSISLNMKECHSVADLLTEVDLSKLRFEAYLNNLSEKALPPMSLQGAPLDVLMQGVGSLTQFRGKHFFFMIDEYENFQDYQQIILNTLIKHASDNYCFKIGVRELGWRMRNTLNSAEQLNSPADYVRIDIAEKLDGQMFGAFAAGICNQRISQLTTQQIEAFTTIQDILPSLSEEQEALHLGVQKKVEEKANLLSLTPDVKKRLFSLRPLEAWMVIFWAESQKFSVEAVLNECESGNTVWNTRYENYRHAILFSIRSRKAGIRKYYAGWDTFLLLSNRNIRYLLELVDQTLVLHSKENSAKLGSPVPFETQTKAAVQVGRKNLTELEGLSVHGASLTKLVLGLGRIFQIMAQDPGGHAPEVNQFHLTDSLECPLEVDALLHAAVMHLALVRSTATKLADSELKDYDYGVHPIFAPFFVFSYRKKRKMTLQPSQLLGLTRSPTKTITEILEAHDREVTDDLPEQLLLFGSYYGRA